MSNTNARARVSLAEGLLEFEGTEDFVAAQLVRFEKVIGDGLQKTQRRTAEHQDRSDTKAPSNSMDSHQDGLSSYENLFAIADGKVQILKSLPGSTSAHKTVSAALLLAFANDLQKVASTSYESIRATCKAHACLDGSNFSGTIKDKKEYFLVSGSGSSQAISLTVPGKKKAKELAASLNA